MYKQVWAAHKTLMGVVIVAATQEEDIESLQAAQFLLWNHLHYITFSHLADAFIQSDLHIHITFLHSHWTSGAIRGIMTWPLIFARLGGRLYSGRRALLWLGGDWVTRLAGSLQLNSLGRRGGLLLLFPQFRISSGLLVEAALGALHQFPDIL